MCQQGEAEGNYLAACDRATRKRGFDAFKKGKPTTEAETETDHPIAEYSDRHQWLIGWRIAESGRELW